jgi:hypothetical protein
METVSASSVSQTCSVSVKQQAMLLIVNILMAKEVHHSRMDPRIIAETRGQMLDMESSIHRQLMKGQKI